jgi:3-methyladenine DNA glycosylase AlkD
MASVRKVSAAPSANTVVRWLKSQGQKSTRDGMTRYGLPNGRAFGVPVGVMQREAKRIGRNQGLAAALWHTGWYEARMMAAFVGDPEELSAAQMDAWCRDFDNWGICDTLCFHLFDRTPHAWAKVKAWTRRPGEFEKRAGFALLASLALHDKAAPDEPFIKALPLIEREAVDDRNFVKKGISWALRLIGRRNVALNTRAVEVAKRLAASEQPGPRWVGRDALRELTSTPVVQRLARAKKR